MSILNRPSDGLPSVLLIIYRTLSHSGPRKREDLMQLVAPESLGSGGTQARQTLNKWLDFKLFVEVDGKITIPSEHLSAEKSDFALRRSLARHVRNIVLAPENNSDLLTNRTKSADFCYALCWALAQDVYRLAGGPHRGIEQVESRQLGGAKAFSNSTRWDGFKDWVAFLGFGWNGINGHLTIDPGIALEDECGKIFNGVREFPISPFIELLSERLPVLDSGKYRKQVEKGIREGTCRKISQHQISPSLSRGLLRLVRAGKIQMRSRSDSKDNRDLLGRDFRTIRSVSHIVQGETT